MNLLHGSQWEGVNLRDVLARTGTPALILSEARLLANIRELRDGLSSSWGAVTIRYCAKTNPELTILCAVRAAGVQVMASQELEVRLALAAGFDPSSIAYQRPVLDPSEVERVIDAGVHRFHAFRVGDLDVLSSAAPRAGRTLRVSLRVATEHSTLPLLGLSAQRMGFEAASLTHDSAVKPRSGIVIDALNTYRGTQQTDPNAFRSEVRAMVRAALALRQRGVSIEEINLGGGVPSPSLRRRTSIRRLLRKDGGFPRLSLRDYATRLSSIFAEEAGRDDAFRPRLVVEPGRSIVGNAVVLLTRVAAAQGKWRFLDAGRNLLVESPIAFSRIIEPLEPRRGTASVHLSGPTLNTLDVVDYSRSLPTLDEGDVLVVGDAGAYCFARATRYAGLLPAMWAAGADGSIRCIRPADAVGDFVR